MKNYCYFLPFVALACIHFAPCLSAQEIDGSDVRRELRERDERVGKLSVEEQLKLRAAEQKAADDPELKEALARRNKAIGEFRAIRRASMIKADPTVAPILDKVAIGADRGF